MRGAHHCSPPGLRNDLYCVEWDVKLYTMPDALEVVYTNTAVPVHTVN